MAERIGLTLEPQAAAMMAGGDPVAITVTVQNLSGVVDQFDIALLGVPPDWYELEPLVVSAFPGESAQATLRLKPPRREDVTAGDYPVTLTVTSRDQPTESSSATLTLVVRPSGGFELVLTKSKAVGRSGSFRAHLTNLSDGSVELLLRLSDPAAALVLRPREQNVTLAPYRERDVTFSARPKKRPLVGEGEIYPLTIEAIPKLPDPREAAGLTQVGQGEFVFKPWLRRWPWAPLPGWARLALMAAVPALAGLVLLLALTNPLGGADGGGGGTPTPVSVAKPPVIDRFELKPADGDTYELAWQVSGQNVETLLDNEQVGTFGSRPADPGEHVLEARNDAGKVIERRCTVSLAVPRIIEFKAEPTSVVAGEKVTFSWEVEGVVDRADINGEEIICDSREGCGNTFPKGERTLTVKTDTNYLLTVENEIGLSAERTRVEVQP